MSTSTRARPNADPEFRDFAELSARLGRDRLLVQAAGGNTSFKVGAVLWIKASGTELSRADRDDVFVPVALAGVRAAIARGEEDPGRGQVVGDTALRPSIELTVHVLMPDRVVLHVHSVNALAWAIREDGRDRVAERLDGLPWAWVPYRRPGWPLTRAVQEVSGAAEARVLVLANHGLVVTGSDCASAERLLREVDRRLAVPPRAAPPPDLAALAALAADGGYRLPAHPGAHRLGTDPSCFTRAREGVPYPDHVVFLDPAPAVVEARGTESTVVARSQAWLAASPSHVLVEGAGVLVSRASTPAAEAMLLCQADVLARTAGDARLRLLSAAETQELQRWDAEKFRRALSAATPPAQ